MFKFSNIFKHSVKYDVAIQEIHKDIDMSSDRALEIARQILSESAMSDKSKAERLKKLGFSSVPQVAELLVLEAKQAKYERIQENIERYSKEFPLNKYITNEEVDLVCEKYNLYLGEIYWFNGFVPDRNISEMETFSSNYDLNQYYTIGDNQGWGAYSAYSIVTKSDYENFNGEKYVRSPQFKIMAPENQFKITTGMRKQGRRIIDDPIVLCPVKDGFIVVTAWGDEASDPIIVNQKNN